jgi:hypothetical protein
MFNLISKANGKRENHKNESQMFAIFVDHFCEYDYGRERNLEAYGTIAPPDYDLTKTTCPIYIHYSLNDWINHPTVRAPRCFLAH